LSLEKANPLQKPFNGEVVRWQITLNSTNNLRSVRTNTVLGGVADGYCYFALGCNSKAALLNDGMNQAGTGTSPNLR
jgi:hypothetical protein